MTTTTAIGEIIPAIVSALTTALSPVTVYDGSPFVLRKDGSISDGPGLAQYVVIGGSDDPSDSAFTAEQEVKGFLGNGTHARHEVLHIFCLAVGRASRIPAARTLALALVEDTGNHLPAKPTDTSYNALILSVDEGTAFHTEAGARVNIRFTIEVHARLVS